MQKYRKAFIGLSIVFVLSMAGIILLFIANFLIKERMKASIYKLQASFSSLEINLFSRSVQIEELSWNSATSVVDSSGHTIYADLIQLKGIHILPLIFDKLLIVDLLIIDSTNLLYIKDLSLGKSTASDNFFKSVILKKISLQSINLIVKKDTAILLSGSLDANMNHLRIIRDSIQQFIYSFKEVEVTATSIALQDEAGLYRTNIRQVYLNSAQDQLFIDSIELVPRHAKYDFAWKAGKQVACLRMSVPKVVIHKLNYQALLAKQLIADAVHIKSFDLQAFKDKRVPFSQIAYMPLPMYYLNALEWNIKIDTIDFGSSQIKTETYPEKGIAPALITFNNLNGLLLNLNNSKDKKASNYATLQISGLFMNKGRIEASFQFPKNNSLDYYMKGFIEDMDLLILNDALQNAVNIRLKSGYLKSMNFSFAYTDFGARGSLDMAYKGLRIFSLDKNKSSTNEFKTILIYLLVQKNKEIEENLSIRIGTIDVKRDVKKPVFNLWLISILDGMRSSFSGGDKPKHVRKQ